MEFTFPQLSLLKKPNPQDALHLLNSVNDFSLYHIASTKVIFASASEEYSNFKCVAQNVTV